MLRLHCPICGLRDETEFTYGGDATVRRPKDDETDPRPWLDYVFYRDNPRGAHLEYWQHQHGCRQWLVVERDTLTHAVRSCRLARDVAKERAAAEAADNVVPETSADRRSAAAEPTAPPRETETLA